MEDAYLQQFIDERIRQRLLHRDTPDRLEAVLEHDQHRMRQLAALPGASEHGDRVDQTEAARLLSTECAEVDAVLGVSGLQPPTLEGERLFSGKNADIVAAFGGGLACLATSAALLT